MFFVGAAFSTNNLFVILDAWRQSGQLPFEIVPKSDKKRRIAYVVRRAIRQLTLTTLATFFCFISATYTPIMPLQSLGILLSIFALFNYFIAAIAMPSVLLFYEDTILVCMDYLGKL